MQQDGVEQPREWQAGDNLHGDDAPTEASVCFIVVHFHKYGGRMVQYENGLRGVLQPSGAIHGVELDVSHDPSCIHWCLARQSFIRDREADLHLYV